jgi:uncharacterized membrane protein YkvA (DUF1232 family)
MKKPEGFNRFLTIARTYIKDRQTLIRFIDAVKQYAQSKKHLIKNFKTDIETLVNLIKAWIRGVYTEIPKETLILIIAALLYFLSPLDTIPDFLGPLGFTDDATVVLFVMNTIRKEINKYKEWDKKGTSKKN